jgi:hypothetical protein
VTTYSVEPEAAPILVNTPSTGLLAQRLLVAEVSLIDLEAPATTIASQATMELVLGVVEVVSTPSTLRVSDGRITAAVSSIGISSGISELRVNQVAALKPASGSGINEVKTYTTSSTVDVQFKLIVAWESSWAGSPSFFTGGVSTGNQAQTFVIGPGRKITIKNFGLFTLSIPAGPAQSYTIPPVYASVEKADGSTYDVALLGGGTYQTVSGYAMSYSRTATATALLVNDAEVQVTGDGNEFPSYKPTTREFTPPLYADSKIYTMNNRSSRFLMASKPGQAQLTLTYENVRDSLANDFDEFYKQCNGSIKPIALPADFLSGLDSSLKSYVELYGSTLSWRWEEPPSYEFVQKGLVNIRVVLKAYTSPGAIGTGSAVNPGIYSPTDYIDTIRYESFGGFSVSPPPPIDTSGRTGLKWMTYSPVVQTNAGNGLQTRPVHGANKSVYIARVGNNTFDELVTSNSSGFTIIRPEVPLRIYKYNDRGEVQWMIAASLAAIDFNVIYSFGSPSITLTKVNDSFYVVTLQDLSFTTFVAFNSNGAIIYQCKYAGAFGQPRYRADRNELVSVVDPGPGADITVFDAADGSMKKKVRVSTVSNPLAFTFRPNGNMVLATLDNRLIEIDPTYSSIINSKVYQGGGIGISEEITANGNNIIYRNFVFDASLQVSRTLNINVSDPCFEHDTGDNYFVFQRNNLLQLFNVNLESNTLNWFLQTAGSSINRATSLHWLDKTNRRLLATGGSATVFMNEFLLRPNSPNLIAPINTIQSLTSSTRYPPYEPGSFYNVVIFNGQLGNSRYPLTDFVSDTQSLIFPIDSPVQISELTTADPLETSLEFDFDLSSYDVVRDEP